MVRSSFAGDWQLRWITLGAAAGAVVRHLVSEAWNTPAQLLPATLIMMAVCGAAIGAVLTCAAHARVGGFVVGMAGAAASLSGYTALAMDQPASVAIALLLLTPVCVLTGLCAGAFAGTALAGPRHGDAGS